MQTLGLRASQKGLKLIYRVGPEIPRELVGDSGRIRQIILNLIDNAIKFTPQGGVVVLRCEGENHDVRITVHDTGEGIPEEHLSRVFDRFYRVDKARSREMGGTGLGLSIAQTIVNAHGGKIELESAPGQGTTCVVTLPVKGPL